MKENFENLPRFLIQIFISQIHLIRLNFNQYYLNYDN